MRSRITVAVYRLRVGQFEFKPLGQFQFKRVGQFEFKRLGQVAFKRASIPSQYSPYKKPSTSSARWRQDLYARRIEWGVFDFRHMGDTTMNLLLLLAALPFFVVSSLAYLDPDLGDGANAVSPINSMCVHAPDVPLPAGAELTSTSTYESLSRVDQVWRPVGLTRPGLRLVAHLSAGSWIDQNLAVHPAPSHFKTKYGVSNSFDELGVGINELAANATLQRYGFVVENGTPGRAIDGLQPSDQWRGMCINGEIYIFRGVVPGKYIDVYVGEGRYVKEWERDSSTPIKWALSGRAGSKWWFQNQDCQTRVSAAIYVPHIYPTLLRERTQSLDGLVTAVSLARDATPLFGPLHDIYVGNVALGVAGLAADILSLGSASVLKSTGRVAIYKGLTSRVIAQTARAERALSTVINANRGGLTGVFIGAQGARTWGVIQQAQTDGGFGSGAVRSALILLETGFFIRDLRAAGSLGHVVVPNQLAAREAPLCIEIPKIGNFPTVGEFIINNKAFEKVPGTGVGGGVVRTLMDSGSNLSPIAVTKNSTDLVEVLTASDAFAILRRAQISRNGRVKMSIEGIGMDGTPFIVPFRKTTDIIATDLCPKTGAPRFQQVLGDWLGSGGRSNVYQDALDHSQVIKVLKAKPADINEAIAQRAAQFDTAEQVLGIPVVRERSYINPEDCSELYFRQDFLRKIPTGSAEYQRWNEIREAALTKIEETGYFVDVQNIANWRIASDGKIVLVDP